MAKKIVPSVVGGYPDLNLYDNSQDSTWLEDMFTNLPGEFRAAKETQEDDTKKTLELLINASGEMSDDASWSNLMNSLDSTNTDIQNYGSDSTKVLYDITKSIVGNKKSSFDAFDKAVNGMYSDYTSPDGILNPENFKWENVKDKSPEDVRNLMLKVNGYRAQIFDGKGNVKFANYKKGDLNAGTAMQHFDYFDRNLAHIAKSFNEQDKISEAEFDFIFNNPNLTKAEFQTHGKNVVSGELAKIKGFDTKLANLKKFSFDLNSAKNEQLGFILSSKKDHAQEEVAEEYLSQALGQSGAKDSVKELNLIRLSEYTPEQLEAGFDGNNQPIPANIVKIYEDMRELVKADIQLAKTNRANSIIKYDWWSPYSYVTETGEDAADIDNVSVETEKGDEFFQAGSDAEGTYDEEGNLVEAPDEDKLPPVVPPVVPPETIKEEKETTKEGVKPFTSLSTEEKKEWANKHKIAKSTRFGANKYVDMTLQQYYNDRAKPKEKPKDINEFMGNLSLGSTTLSSSERNYIKSRSGSGFSTNQLLSLIKKYKMSNNSTEKEQLKLEIEKLIK